MKQSIPRFLLFFTLLSIYSCTLTKRKYTGGYYVHWHSKTPEAMVNKQHEHTTPNTIAQTTSSSLIKLEVKPQTGNTFIEKIGKAINSNHKGTDFTKNISKNPVSSNYTLTPENNTQQQIAPKKDTHGWQVGLAIFFCILGVLGAIIVALLIASAPFFTGAALPLSQALSDALLPLLFLLASLLFSGMAMADGHNKGLIACIILDSIFLLILFFSVFYVIV